MNFPFPSSSFLSKINPLQVLSQVGQNSGPTMPPPFPSIEKETIIKWWQARNPGKAGSNSNCTATTKRMERESFPSSSLDLLWTTVQPKGKETPCLENRVT